MENWALEINQKIDGFLEKVREKDLRFFRVDEFKRNISRTDEFSSDCLVCRNQKDDISEASGYLFEAIQVPGKSRRKYDLLISRISKHMQKEHGFYPPFYYSYLYAFFGLMAGGIGGFLLSKTFLLPWETLYSISFAVCIVATYIVGSIKDKKVRSAKKIM
jgi:hypothetical protein